MALLWEVILIGQMAGGAPEEEEQGCGWGAGGGAEPQQNASAQKADLGCPSHVPPVALYWLITSFNP